MNLELANKRLQSRIIELGEVNDKLTRQLSSSTNSIKDLNDTIRSLNKSIHILDKENARLRKTKTSTDKLTVVTSKNPALKDRNIMKVVDKILRNKRKYNLKPIELKFLKSIRYLKELSEKQNSWLIAINLRSTSK
tara:strand:- start:810 stop:1217 length:408 start_codon:yes stop_codon:yes gene_type:complete